jgi:hypothetical protein
LPTKGSFLSCVPERVIMLTTFVYCMHKVTIENRKSKR